MQTHTKRNRQNVKVEFEVNGELWRRVSSFEGAGPSDRVYVSNMNEDKTTTVMFGDGKRGARLPTGADQVIATYTPSNRYTAVLIQRGRVILDSDWNEIPGLGGRFYGIYYGIVTENADPSSLCRLRVRIPEVLGNQEEWALPSVPVGATAIPAVGKAVWIAFESGDPSRTVWIGTPVG
jgi:hypothetical protein